MSFSNVSLQTSQELYEDLQPNFPNRVQGACLFFKPLSLQSRTDDRGGDGVLLAARLALGTAIVWGLFQLEWFRADGLNRNGVPVHDSKSMAILQMFRAYGTHI